MTTPRQFATKREDILRKLEALRPRAKRDVVTLSEDKLDEYSRKLEQEGVVVVEDVFTKDQIEAFREGQSISFDHVMELANAELIPKTETTWIAEFDDRRNLKKVTYMYDGYSNIILGSGRYDFQWGFYNGIFDEISFYFPYPINKLVEKGLNQDFHRVTGALPIKGNEESTGDWHRDTVPLFSPDIDYKLPPWYYTTLVPLQDLTLQNGATMFIPGSHKCCYEDAKNFPRARFEAKAGSVILLDGRILHKGMPNTTPTTRTVLYSVYVKNWYTTYYDGLVIN